MFEHLKPMPADPILGLNMAFQQDYNPEKINLSIGVYQDDTGQTPIFKAVKQAEQQLIDAQKTKSYAPQAGDPAFLSGTLELLLGKELMQSRGAQIAAVATPGGCGALRMGAELLVSAKRDARVWVSSPTWANHFPLLESAGLMLVSYDYYNTETNRIDFDDMLKSLDQAVEGDVVLLHGCCHNPTGADLTQAQWDDVIDLLEAKRLTPFIDVAYQGFGSGLDEDAYGVRQAVSRLPEVLIADSCSKNFGLYRERTGAIIVVTESEAQTTAAKTHILTAARRNYSMAPYHGEGIVGLLLADAGLAADWKAELNSVRNHMNGLRNKLANELNSAQSIINFDFVSDSNGMFCFLGIPKDMVLALRQKYGIYLLDSTRINIAGLSDDNLPVIVDRVTGLLKGT